MGIAPVADKDTETQAAAKPKKSRKGLFILLALLLLLGGGGAAAYKFLVLDKQVAEEGALDGAEETPAKLAPHYIELRPAFVSNLSDSDVLRFVQAEVDLMTRDPEVPMKVEEHMPAIRHALLLTLTSRRFADLLTQQGKDQTLQDMRQDINKLLLDRTGIAEPIEEVYFTSLVVQ
nr:flagellar basal body-associated FliL family protein [Oceanococcus sp. HetDA_MAG_MS8]